MDEQHIVPCKVGQVTPWLLGVRTCEHLATTCTGDPRDNQEISQFRVGSDRGSGQRDGAPTSPKPHSSPTPSTSLPYSSGVVEGHNNKIKMLKRQLFDRANFDLLRKRVFSSGRGGS